MTTITGPTSDTEDELLLSPAKQETYTRTNYSKRLASPPPEDEHSPLSGSLFDHRNPKRMKRDLGLEDSDSDRTSLKSKDSLHQRSTRGHARNLSDSAVLTGKCSTRKRSATTTKKPVSTSPTPSPATPKKGRAQSVPLFASFNDIPRIDFRNPPPSPKRSRSPSKDRELKLRIARLDARPDETSSTTEVGSELGSTLKATEMLLLPKITEETQPTAPINETSALDPPASPILTTQITCPKTPSTPLAEQSLNNLMPMSPLTPLLETPFPTRLGTDVEDRGMDNAGWKVSSLIEASPPFDLS